ncbi:hypothetical protein Tco_0522025 [Tanacetum coccineum]
MDVGSVNVPYLLARYLRLFDARGGMSGAPFLVEVIARLAEHFANPDLRKILQGIGRAAKGAPIVDEGDQANLAPIQAPPPPPAAARTISQRMAN